MCVTEGMEARSHLGRKGAVGMHRFEQDRRPPLTYRLTFIRIKETVEERGLEAGAGIRGRPGS